MNEHRHGPEPVAAGGASARLTALAGAVQLMRRAGDFDALMQTVTDASREIVGARQAVTSFTLGRDWSQAITGLSLTEPYVAYREYGAKPDGSGIYALVCETNRPMRMTQEELERHPRWRGFGAEAGKHPPMRGWLAVPLVGRDGRNLGLIQLTDRIEGEFTEEDEAVLVQFSEIASLALELKDAQAHLEGQVAERAAEARRARSETERFFALTVQMLCLAGFDGYFKELNPAWEKTLGWTPEELKAQPFVDFVHPEDRQATLAEAARLAAGDYETISFENRYRCKDGTYRWLQWRSVGDPETGLLYAAATDVTAERRARERLRRYAVELERSNQDLQDFAATASHDLQEPLRKIVAFGDRLAARAGERLDEDGRGYLARMQDAARRMGHLIESLLELSRVATSTRPFQPVDLSALAAEVLSDLDVRIRETGARVEVASLPRVEADAEQMRRLLQNLFSNALKFQPPGRTPELTVACETTAAELRLSVADNGVGFDANHADRLFKPFQRLHARGEFPGSGMGLAICRRIAERHGGRISASSGEGAGSTFVITLPLKHPER